MKKVIFLILVLLLLVVAGIVTLRISGTFETDSVSKITNIDDFKIGDKVGDITVSKITDIITSAGVIGKRVTFQGDLIITGVCSTEYSYFAGQVETYCMFNKADNPQIPSLIIESGVLLGNETFAQKILAPYQGKKITVRIRNYSFARAETEARTYGDLVSVEN